MRAFRSFAFASLFPASFFIIWHPDQFVKHFFILFFDPFARAAGFPASDFAILPNPLSLVNTFFYLFSGCSPAPFGQVSCCTPRGQRGGFCRGRPHTQVLAAKAAAWQAFLSGKLCRMTLPGRFLQSSFPCKAGNMRQTLRDAPFRGDLAEFIIPEREDRTVNSAGSAFQKALCRVLPGYGRLSARNSAGNGLSGGFCRVYPNTGNPPNELLEFERANGVRRGQPETANPKRPT